MSHSSSAKLPMLLRTIEMTFSFRSHLIAETMQFTSVQSIWVPQILRKLALCSILDRNTWPSLVYFVMMRQQETTSSRSMIHCLVVSSKETKPTRDARLWLTICTSPSQTRFCQRPHLNLPTDQPSSKVSYGRITLASSH